MRKNQKHDGYTKHKNKLPILLTEQTEVNVKVIYISEIQELMCGPKIQPKNKNQLLWKCKARVLRNSIFLPKKVMK